MAARWQQWMPFHIDRWKGSAHVQAMSPTARSGYLYLLTSAWQTVDCSLPADDEELAVLAGLTPDEWKENGPVIRRRFSCDEEGRLFNDVLREEWSEAKHIFEARQSNARRTNSVRSSSAHYAGTADHASRSAATVTDTSTDTETTTRQRNHEQPDLASVLAMRDSAGFALPLNDGSEFSICESQIREWESLYPATDVRQEIRNYRGWALATPTRRKTRRGILSSVNGWLARSHHRKSQGGNANLVVVNSSQRRAVGNIDEARRAFERIAARADPTG